MFSTKAISRRALSRASCQLSCPTARRLYATDHEQRTQKTLEVSSRLTWLTTAAAIGAATLYYTTTTTTTTSSSSSSSNPSSSQASHASPDSSHSSRSGHRHEAAYSSDVPKPVEDRHGDTVKKHSIAAHKNQAKVRQGKFSGEEFDNHMQKHSPGNPGGDFEKR